MADDPEIYRAIEAFSYDSRDGITHVVKRGDLYADDSEAYRGREALFEHVDPDALKRDRNRTSMGPGNGAPTAVETATAAPGEKRQRSAARG